MKYILIALFPLLFISQLSHAQKVEVIKFHDLEKALNTPSDTVVIYNFWATWCKPCVEEMPGFEKFYEDYADKKVKLVFVSMDFISQRKKVEKFVAEKQFKAPVQLLNDQNYNVWLDKVSNNWQGSIPATCVVYGPKATRRFNEGPMTYQELEQFIKPILNQ